MSDQIAKDVFECVKADYEREIERLKLKLRALKERDVQRAKVIRAAKELVEILEMHDADCVQITLSQDLGYGETSELHHRFTTGGAIGPILKMMREQIQDRLVDAVEGLTDE
ncbi:MAG: hypothetical protein CL489_06925 [Acidobacteria bacterium]|nr:hypothetical protein [Acidobacteriota bacterium]|tara:strand:+ start:94 stop:429 length:336 start_codon:yes stop_codon:yes gene_type:complete